MSQIRDAIVDFADAILQHFPPYRWEEHQEKAWAETLVKELAGFSTGVVKRASEELIRKRKKTQTPLISECIDACLEARKWADRDSQQDALRVDRLIAGHLDWTADRLKLASELMNTPLGKQAAKEGWVGALWSFARKHSRLPQQGKEVDGCKRDSKGFDDAYAICVRNQHNPMMAALEKLGAEMLRRRHVIEQRLLRG